MTHLHEMRILAIDDDPRSLKLIKAILESNGYGNVQTVSSGEEGLEWINEAPPDLVLLDIIMPGMNGYEFCRNLRKNETTRHIPVLMVTGMPSEEDETVKQSFEAGATDFITKPIRSTEFLARVKSSLMIKRAYDRLQEEVRKRKQSEIRIDRLNSILRAVININQLIVREKDRDRLLKGACESLTQARGYHSAWIVLLDSSRNLIGSAESGLSDAFLSMVERIGMGLLPRCIERTVEWKGVSAIEDTTLTCADCLLKNKYQDRTILTIRLEYERNVYGVLTVSVPSSFVIDHEELELMEEVANDLGFALYNIDQEEAHKRMEREKEKLEAQLRQAQKMEAIGTLAGGIAHDFNNILGAIIGYAEMVEIFDIPADSPVQPNLKELLKAAYRAKDLVQQILTFSRRTEQARRPVPVGPIIKETLRFLRASLPRTIEIRQNISEPSDTVLADPTQIHQVLMNLCTNAAHAMQERGGILEVGLSRTDLSEQDVRDFLDLKAGSYLMLTVKDTGHGMDRHVMDRIFDPYFTTKKHGEGTGMGLAVSLGILRNHGGTISVKSKVGEGSLFQVFLPALMSGEVTVSETEEFLPLSGGSERILLVDDEESLVDVGQTILERLGYQVTGKTSSSEALETFRSEPNRFDLIITDLTMPQMTGLELVHHILSICPEIPIILCTGFSEKVTEENAKIAGVREWISKPISARSLSEIIRKVLDHES